MPFPIAAAIAAGSALLGQGINAYSTGRQNRKSRMFSREMYQRQYDDNLALWNLQNEYNHPLAQMQRLKGAGLNPALMYGGSASGASGQAGSLQAPSAMSADFRVPTFDPMPVLDMYFNTELKSAQVGLLEAQKASVLEDAMLKNAQKKNILTSEQRSRFDLELEKQLRNVSIDYRTENLRKLRVDNRFRLDENERRSVMNSANLRESLERVLNMRASRANTKAQLFNIKAQAANIRRDIKLKDLDIELKRTGIQPGDPAWTRILTRILQHAHEQQKSKGKSPWWTRIFR